MPSIAKTSLSLALALTRDETEEYKNVFYFFKIQEALLLNTSIVSLYTNEGWWPLAYCEPKTFGIIVCSGYLKWSVSYLAWSL